MFFPAATALAAFLSSELPAGGAPTVLEKLSCLDHLDYDRKAGGILWVKHESARWNRIEGISLFSNGYVVLYVQVPEAGLLDCRARIGSERLLRFKTDINNSKVWRVRGPRQVYGERDSLYLALDRTRRCDFAMSAQRWAQLPAAQAVQEAIDQLKRDLCGGACPEPSKPTQLRSPDASVPSKP